MERKEKMNHDLRTEVESQINRLGENEFRLAYSRAKTKEARTIIELIEEFRKPFTEGLASIGSMVVANQETWARLAERSDPAAKRELLANSAVLTELNELERKAREAQKASAWKLLNSQLLESIFQQPDDFDNR
jgi:hypothetical protein